MLSELAFQSREKSLDELPIGSIVLPRLEGLVSSYNNLFQTGGGEFQTVSPGAFEMLKTPPSVPLLRINHVEELTVPGSLRLFTNWEGLNFEAMLTDSRISRDLILAIRHGHLTGVSPAWTYKGLDRKFSDGEKYVEINQIIKIDEISFCSNPAQNETRCGFAGRARLSGPSQFAPLLSSEATRLQYSYPVLIRSPNLSPADHRTAVHPDRSPKHPGEETADVPNPSPIMTPFSQSLPHLR